MSQFVEGVYIIDSLENIEKYANVGRYFPKAVERIRRGEFDLLTPGRNEIDGDNVWVNCDEPELVPPTERRVEVHHRYFDIQIPLAGEETFGIAPFDPSAPGSFDETRDIGFYEMSVKYFTLKPGEFAIFYPKTCAHAPGCTLGAKHRSRKLVFKIKA